MNELVKRIGIDKIAHLGVGGLLCAMVSMPLMFQDGVTSWQSLLYTLIGWLFVFVISVFKEGFIDDRFEWADIIYALVGCALFTASSAFGIMLYVLSH